jgi:hypothetical protein
MKQESDQPHSIREIRVICTMAEKQGEAHLSAMWSHADSLELAKKGERTVLNG